MNYWQLSYYGIDYCVSAFKQLQFMRRFLYPIVNRLCQTIEYQFSEKEKQKATFFYPVFNHIFNCENYLVLKNRKLTLNESRRLAIISVMATLYDDLIDEEKWDEDSLFQVLHRTLPIKQQTPKVKLIFALDDALKLYWQPTKAYKNALQIAIEWQWESQRQLQPTITLDDILYLSKQKCGNSSLLWASILDETWDEKEEQFIYQSGYVGQLVNDAMDAFKDREDGVKTYVFASATMKIARDKFIEECQKLHQSIAACSAPIHLKDKTINRMATLHGFALVSLDHLQNTENKYGLPVEWSEVQRKDLITDMAIWSNKLKAIQYAKWLATVR